MKINELHKQKVEERGYGYIGTYEKGEYTIDKCNIVSNVRSIIRVKCPYCGIEFDVISYNFISNNQNCGKCCNKYENSFAYHIQVELGEPLNKYWDWEKNTVNPYCIYKGRKGKTKYGQNWKVWIKCTKTDYHDSYEISCKEFIKGNRCSYCSHKMSKRVHPKDSYGSLYPEKAKYWSPRNNKTPFEVTHGTNDVYYHICEECGEEFQRTIHIMTSSDTGSKCNLCGSSKGEQRIKEYLEGDNFIKNIDYIPQKEFKGLVGLGGRNLSYDFYLPKYNLLIEYQGEFHDWSVSNQTKEQFEKQQEHDRRKKQYAVDNSIKLLEIWYWDYKNIEKILNIELIK